MTFLHQFFSVHPIISQVTITFRPVAVCAIAPLTSDTRPISILEETADACARRSEPEFI